MDSYKIVNEAVRRVDSVNELVKSTKDKKPKKKLDFGKYNEEIEVSFKVKGDGKEDVLKILRHLDRVGGTGHSYDIVLDPDCNDTRMKVGWDGDGADSINDIKVNGHKLSRAELQALD